MDLSQIYRPIKEELENVEGILEASFQETKNKSILKVNRFLLEAPGKRLRPALVILSAKATLKQKSTLRLRSGLMVSEAEPSKAINEQLIKVAAAIELIHMASLIHDDVIDHSALRHHRPTVNSKWGQDASIALGDYLYSLAFGLISACDNMDILECISSATKAMCEGELIQILERDNLSLLRQRYILIVKKKTASLFAASCQAGAITSCSPRNFTSALKGYGLNFGIAFQIVDDCLDLVGEIKDLGKAPGADFKMGELTLPILNLLSQSQEKERIISLLRESQDSEAFKEIRRSFLNSGALLKTKNDLFLYIQRAKGNLGVCPDSEYKKSLEGLADFISQRAGF